MEDGFRLPFQSQHVSIMSCHCNIVIHLYLWQDPNSLPQGDCNNDILYTFYYFHCTLLSACWSAHAVGSILQVQYSLQVFQKMHHVCTWHLRETLESTPKHVGLVSVAHHHASYWSGSVVAAAYWLLQTRPASGKHSALQQLFQALPNAQSLPQTTAVFDS